MIIIRIMIIRYLDPYGKLERGQVPHLEPLEDGKADCS